MNAEQKENLRHAVLEFLVLRHPSAFPPRALRRRLAEELDFLITEEDIAIACEFLIGMGHARLLPDALGSTNYFSATSSGVLAFERGLNPGRPGHD